MLLKQKLYVNKDSYRAYQALIATKYSGKSATIEEVDDSKTSQPQFVEKFLGKVCILNEMYLKLSLLTMYSSRFQLWRFLLRACLVVAPLHIISPMLSFVAQMSWSKLKFFNGLALLKMTFGHQFLLGFCPLLASPHRSRYVPYKLGI